MHLDLRRLQHLLALDDHRHFARAAEQVHLSQPAFSRSIQALEQALGQRLFERGAGHIRPTPAGVLLLERARRMEQEARQLLRDLQRFGQLQLGDLAFGVGPFPAATFVPEAVAALRREHPELRLRVETGNWARLLEQLRSEALEFFVADLRELPRDADLSLVPMGVQAGGFYGRSGHPLAGQHCTLQQMWSYGVASTRLPAPVKTALARALGLGPGEPLTLALECDDLALLRAVGQSSDTVIGMTAAAALDTLAGTPAAGHASPRSPWVRLNVADVPPLTLHTGLVSLRQRSPSPAAQRAMAMLAQAAEQVQPSAT
ncbi:MAG: LysR family transcriptional regulator [Rubrivivax sp.]|jgi:DNA-binding transcriptional LysR family regulator|nr:LysR family transcriptional regulator [Rubrivivax sp.]